MDYFIYQITQGEQRIAWITLIGLIVIGLIIWLVSFFRKRRRHKEWQSRNFNDYYKYLNRRR